MGHVLIDQLTTLLQCTVHLQFVSSDANIHLVVVVVVDDRRSFTAWFGTGFVLVECNRQCSMSGQRSAAVAHVQYCLCVEQTSQWRFSAHGRLPRQSTIENFQDHRAGCTCAKHHWWRQIDQHVTRRHKVPVSRVWVYTCIYYSFGMFWSSESQLTRWAKSKYPKSRVLPVLKIQSQSLNHACWGGELLKGSRLYYDQLDFWTSSFETWPWDKFHLSFATGGCQFFSVLFQSTDCTFNLLLEIRWTSNTERVKPANLLPFRSRQYNAAKNKISKDLAKASAKPKSENSRSALREPKRPTQEPSLSPHSENLRKWSKNGRFTKSQSIFGGLTKHLHSLAVSELLNQKWAQKATDPSTNPPQNQGRKKNPVLSDAGTAAAVAWYSPMDAAAAVAWSVDTAERYRCGWISRDQQMLKWDLKGCWSWTPVFFYRDVWKSAKVVEKKLSSGFLVDVWKPVWVDVFVNCLIFDENVALPLSSQAPSFRKATAAAVQAADSTLGDTW